MYCIYIHTYADLVANGRKTTNKEERHEGEESSGSKSYLSRNLENKEEGHNKQEQPRERNKESREFFAWRRINESILNENKSGISLGALRVTDVESFLE